MASVPTPKRAVSNLLGLPVLSYLPQGPMHAYELQRQLKENDAARTFKLSHGALYSVVGQLERAGSSPGQAPDAPATDRPTPSTDSPRPAAPRCNRGCATSGLYRDRAC